MRRNAILQILLPLLFSGCQHGASTQDMSTGSTQQPKTAESSTGDSTAKLYVMGMACPLCANNIDKQLLRVPGVEKVSVDLGSGLVTAKLAPANPPSREELAAAIAQSGFTLDRIEMPAAKGGGQ